MYKIRKTMEIAASHKLALSYESKCQNLHGHNWLITVFCKAQKLNKDGMVIDFTHIKKLIHEKLDHAYLNDVLPMSTTAENIAEWCCAQINDYLTHEMRANDERTREAVCYKVEVIESSNNLATYEL